MNAKEAEVLLEQSLENYANGCAGKQELIADIRKLWYLEEGDADAMQNVYLYLHLVKEVVERNASPESVKASLQRTRKLIRIDKMWEEMAKYKNLSGARTVDLKGKKTLYLDQNLFTRLLEGDTEKEGFPGKVQIVYSPAHIEEIYKSEEEYHKKELQKISYFTDNVILLYLDDVPTWMQEEPGYSYQRIKRTEKATQLAEEYKVLEQTDGDIFLPQYNTNQYRQIFNGQKPETFLWNFTKEVNAALRCLGAAYTVEQLEASEEPYRYSDINGKIHTLYKAMDLLGFKKDKIKNGNDRKVRSSRHDIEHLLYASSADYFCTADENMYFRAVNLFKLLKKGTDVKKCNDIHDIVSAANDLAG